MINKKMKIALDLVGFLGTTPKRLDDFCLQFGYSKEFVQQIGLRLSRNKVINTKRGPGGGYIKSLPVSYYDIHKSLHKTKFEDSKIKEALSNIYA